MDLSSKKISSSVNQRNSSGQGNRSIGRMANYSGKTQARQLTEGQVIKGEITDLRNNEVSILLDDNTSVTGRLDHVNWLSIGDVAAFRVTEILPGKINLQAIPLNESAVENNTMFKALEEAGLPHSSRNQSIVLSLIQNQMPITKQSILDILKQSYELKEAGINTIVLMKKYSIPATHENAAQFENYQSNEHQLSSELQECINTIPDLLKNAACLENGDLQQTASQLFSILDLQPETSLTEDMVFTADNITAGAMAADTPENPTINQAFAFPSERAKNELLSILSDFDLPDEILNSIKDNTISLNNLYEVIENVYENAAEIDERNQNQVMQSLSPAELANPDAVQKALKEVPRIVDAFDSTIISQIQTAYEDALKESKLTGGYFSMPQRQFLASFVNNSLGNQNIGNRIINGQATLKETLLAIQDQINTLPEKAIQQLFQSDEFAFLLSNELSSQWYLNPKQIQQDKGINQFYGKLSKQIKAFTELMNSNSDLQENYFQDNIANTGNNIHFMQMLNGIFPYVQIPFQANGFPGHGELYVYTKKDELRKNPKNISVLLHLSLEHLGNLDIHITMNGNSLDNKFFVENQKSRRLIKKNIELAESRLRELGYSVTTEFIQKETKTDIVKDFISKQETKEEIKRYTFDIRA